MSQKQTIAVAPIESPTVGLHVADYLRTVSPRTLDLCCDTAIVPWATVEAARVERARRQALSPRRIQRKRSRGWRMPDNTVYVGRPSRWGNPYSLEHLLGSHGDEYTAETGLTRILADFEAWARAMLGQRPDWLAPLRGKDLCCWCREGHRCHADILLRLANEPPTPLPS